MTLPISHCTGTMDIPIGNKQLVDNQRGGIQSHAGKVHRYVFPYQTVHPACYTDDIQTINALVSGCAHKLTNHKRDKGAGKRAEDKYIFIYFSHWPNLH